MPAPTFEQWVQLNKEELNRYGITSVEKQRQIYNQKISRHEFDDNSSVKDSPKNYSFKGPDTKIPFMNQQQINEQNGIKDTRYSDGTPMSTADMIKDYNERQKSKRDVEALQNNEEANTVADTMQKINMMSQYPSSSLDTMVDRTDDIQRASQVSQDFRDIQERHIPYTFTEKDKNDDTLMNEYVKKYDAAFSKYRRMPSLRNSDANNIIKMLTQEGNTYYDENKDLFDPNKPENQQWWMDLLSAVNGIQGSAKDGEKGKEQAIKEIHERVATRAMNNMGYGDMAWRTIRGGGANAISSVIGAAGLAWGTISFIPRLFGAGNNYDGLNNFEYALASLFVNDIGNYAGNLMRQGTMFHQVDNFDPEIHESYTQLPNTTLGAVGTFVQQFGFTYGSGALSRVEAGAVRKMSGFMSSRIQSQVRNNIIAKSVAEEAFRNIAKRENLLMKGQYVQLAAAEGVVNASDAYLEMTKNNNTLIEEAKKANAWAIYGELLSKYGWPCDKNGVPTQAQGEIQPNLGDTIVVQDYDGNYYRIRPEQQQEFMEQANAQAEKDALLDQTHSEAINRKAAALAGLESTLTTMATNYIGGIFHLDSDVRALTARSRMFQPRRQNVGIRNGRVELLDRNRTKWQTGFNTEIRAFVDGASEFSEETVQGITAAMMEGLSKNSMVQFLEARYLGDGNVETGDLLATGWLGAMKEGAKEYYEKDFWRDGLSGFLMSRVNLAPGNIISNIDLSSDVAFKDRFKGFKRQEGETKAQHFDRVSPIRLGHVSALGEYQKDMSEIDEYIAAANKAISDNPNFATVVNALNWGEQLSEANTTGDMANLQSTALGQMTHILMDMKNYTGKLDNVAIDENGTTINQYKLLQQKMERIANGEMTDQEVKDQMEQYNKGREDVEKLNEDQVKEKAKEGAERVLKAMQAIDNATDKVNKNKKYRDRASRELMVYMQAHSEMYKQDIEKLESEINAIYQKAAKELGGDNSERNIRKPFGIFKSRANKALGKKLKNLETQRQFLENKIKQIDGINDLQLAIYKAQHGQEFDKQAAIDEYSIMLQNVNNEIQNLRKESKGILSEGKDEDVLSAAEIMKLPSEERAFMLDHGHESLFSEKQLEVIHNLRNLGLNEDSSFMEMINQHASMTNLQERNGRIFSKNVADQEWLSRMIGKAKMYGSMKLGNDMAASLEKIMEYGDFVSLYKGNLESNDAIAIRAMQERLIKDHNVNFERMRKSDMALEEFVSSSRDNTITKDNQISDNEEERQKYIDYAVRAVQMVTESNGLNVMRNEVQPEVASEAIKKIAKSEGENLTDEQVGRIIETIKKIVKNAEEKKKKKEERKNTTTPQPETTAPKNPSPALDTAPKPVVDNPEPVGTVPQQNGTEPQGNNEGENKEVTIDDICGEEIKELFTNIELWINVWKNTSIKSDIPTIVKIVKEAITEAKANNETDQQFLNRVIVTTNTYIKIDNSDPVVNACQWIKSIITSISQRNGKGNSDVHGTGHNVDNTEGTIETMDASNANNQYSGYYQKYKVHEFINSGLLTGDEIVYFYSDVELNGQLEGQTFTSDNKEYAYPISCVAIVPLTNEMKAAGFTGINIDGKLYQPIGLLPANIAGGAYEAKDADYVRNHIDSGANENHIVSDGDNPITMRLSEKFLLYSNKKMNESRKKLKDHPIFKDMNKVLTWIIKTKLHSKNHPEGTPILGIGENMSENHSRMWKKKNNSNTDASINNNNNVKIWIAEMNDMVHQGDGKTTLEEFLNREYSPVDENTDIANFNDRFKQLQGNLNLLVSEVLGMIKSKYPKYYEDFQDTNRRDNEGLYKGVEELIVKYIAGNNSDKTTDNTIFNLPDGVSIKFRLVKGNGVGVTDLEFYLDDPYDENNTLTETVEGVEQKLPNHFHGKVLCKINLIEYEFQKESPEIPAQIVNATNILAQNLILDTVGNEKGNQPIARRNADDSTIGYAKWNVSYGLLTENHTLFESDITSDSMPKRTIDDTDATYNEKLSNHIKAQTFKQLYKSGIFEISAHVTNISLDIPSKAQSDDPKTPEVSQPANADYGTNGGTDNGPQNNPPLVVGNAIQKAVEALKKLLNRPNHSDKTNKKRTAISVSEILNINDEYINGGDNAGTIEGKIVDACLRLFAENYSRFRVVTSTSKKNGIEIKRTYLASKDGNKDILDIAKGLIKDSSFDKNSIPQLDKKIITIYENIKKVFQDIELNGGTIMARYTTTGGKTAFHSIAGDNPLEFTLVEELLCNVNGKQKSIPISYQPDMISIDKDGNIVILDFKTSNDSDLMSDQQKYEKYCRQLQFYRNLIMTATGLNVSGLNIIHFNRNEYTDMKTYSVPMNDVSIDYETIVNKLTERIEKAKNLIDRLNEKLEKEDRLDVIGELNEKISELIKERDKWQAKLEAIQGEQKEIESQLAAAGEELNGPINGVGVGNGGVVPTDAGGIPLTPEQIERRAALVSNNPIILEGITYTSIADYVDTKLSDYEDEYKNEKVDSLYSSIERDYGVDLKEKLLVGAKLDDKINVLKDYLKDVSTDDIEQLFECA